ncbi:MAG TPA: hypothetical protein VF873_03430 [Gemmatimonadales bacterium]
MQSILGGAVIVAIGLVWGHSVFRGDFNVLSILFDGFGVFFIIRGLMSVYQAKQQESVSAPPPPPPAR